LPCGELVHRIIQMIQFVDQLLMLVIDLAYVRHVHFPVQLDG
jgi:hypothetical protein